LKETIGVVQQSAPIKRIVTAPAKPEFKMGSERGRSIPLSLPRRWIGDMLHFAMKVPLVAAERTLRIRTLVEARRATPFAPSWYATMFKAFAMVSERIPELRRAYMPFPWPHFYEHPFSVGSVVITREYEGEPATFLCPVLHPERLPLTKLHDKLQSLQNDPVEKHGSMRRLIRTSKLPRPIRRLFWATGLYLSGSLRAGNFGTFSINTNAKGRGIRTLQFVTPLTSVFYFGLPSNEGSMDTQLAFDHRVFDGATAYRIGSELESVLNRDLAAETRVSGRPHGQADQAAA
jgi:hypothetical protein